MNVGSKRRLEHFSYTDPELTEAVFTSMWDVQFQGIKGYIAFDKNGDNKGSVKIRRIQGKPRCLHTISQYFVFLIFIYTQGVSITVQLFVIQLYTISIGAETAWGMGRKVQSTG